MTDSDQIERPADAPPDGPEWKKVAWLSHYEWSHRGLVRSLDRVVNGRSYRGVVLRPRTNNSGYLIVNITGDTGTKQTVLLHRMILIAHAGEPGPGQESLHGKGGQLDNRYPENLRWGTKEQNEADKTRQPRPERERPPCINHDRCGGYVGKGGRRCHECVVDIGRAGASLLADGGDLEQCAELLGYGSATGLWRLAVKYGGLRLSIAEDDETPTAVDYAEQPPSLLRRVSARWSAWLSSSDAP